MSATTASSARRAAPRRAAASRAPRRLSGPVGGRAAARPVPQRTPTVGARALALVRSLPNHSLIDRLVRGRAWIPVLGVLLAGIVAMQVEILKLGTSLGRSLSQTTTLQSQNESLQAQVATLANDQRIQRLGSAMGLVMPSPGLLTFVPSRPQGKLGKAIANIHSPDPGNFATELSAQIASDSLIAPAAPATTTATPGTAQTSASTSTAGTSAATPDTTTSTQPTTSQTTTAQITTTGTGSTGTSTTSTTSAGAASTAASTGTTSTGTVPTGTTSTGAASTGAATGAAGLPTTSTSGTSSGG